MNEFIFKINRLYLVLADKLLRQIWTVSADTLGALMLDIDHQTLWVRFLKLFDINHNEIRNFFM